MADVQLPSVDEMLWQFAKGHLPGTVVNAVPATRPVEFLLVSRIGGGPSSRVQDDAVVMGQGWAKSRARAEEITAAFRDLLLNHASEMPLVRGVENMTGPYWDPDPDSKSPRFTVTARLRVRGRRI